LERALAPSMMNSRGTAGSSPRSTRLSISDWTVATVSVAPSARPSGYEAAGGGRFRQTSPRRPRNVSLRQSNRSGKLPRRDIDQHLVHGPLPEPVLRNAASQLGTGCSFPSKPRSLGRSISTLPPRKPILPFVFPQRCPRRSRPRACRGPQIVCASRSNLGQGLHARSQAKRLEARRNLRQGLKLQRSRRKRSRCSPPAGTREHLPKSVDGNWGIANARDVRPIPPSSLWIDKAPCLLFEGEDLALSSIKAVPVWARLISGFSSSNLAHTFR
jgi:hypothetical protein